MTTPTTTARTWTAQAPELTDAFCAAVADATAALARHGLPLMATQDGRRLHGYTLLVPNVRTPDHGHAGHLAMDEAGCLLLIPAEPRPPAPSRPAVRPTAFGTAWPAGRTGGRVGPCIEPGYGHACQVAPVEAGACPLCGAEVGYRCVTRRGDASDPHRARRLAARAGGGRP